MAYRRRAMNDDLARAFLEEWFRRLWRELDASVVDDRCAEDVLVHGLDGPRRGREQFREFYAVLRALFPGGLDVAVDAALGRDEMVMVRCTARGQTGGGKAVDFTGFAQARIVDGKMAEAWNCWDFMTMLEQAGALPVGSFSAGLKQLLD